MTNSYGDRMPDERLGDGEEKEGRRGELNPTFEGDESTRNMSSNSYSPAAERKVSQTSSGGKPRGILVNGENLPQQMSHQGLHSRKISEYSYPEESRIPYINDTKDDSSWWFLLCTKCRQRESGLGWEPPNYQAVCPYPFCPTYRHLARIFSLVILVLFAWGVVYLIIGEDAAPGGQLFDMAVLCIAANFGGWLFKMCALPPLVGMLAVGILFQNVGLVHIHGRYTVVGSILRKIALVLILTRAGLDLDGESMKKLAFTVLKMATVPWIVESAVVGALSIWIFEMPLMWGILMGTLTAAVSPAVVVPCLMRIRSKGYGVAKGIPSLIIAISGIDDALSVAAFGIMSSIMFSSNSTMYNIILGPLSVVIGIGYGVFWGWLANYVPEKGDPYVVPMRVLIMLGSGLLAVIGSEKIGFEGAGPLGVVASAFLSCVVWVKQGWEVEDNPVATAYEIFWMIFEPILFGLTGTQIKFSEMTDSTVWWGLLIIAVGSIMRIISTVCVGFGSRLNNKEKLFCALSWMAKASVQAALAPVAVELVREENGDETEQKYAKILLLTVIMSIVLTAPLGAVVITFTGKRLLTKTDEPLSTEGWRRSARPSLRDISIFSEEPDPDEEKQRPPPSIINHVNVP